MIDMIIVAQDVAQEMVQEVAPVVEQAAYGWSEMLLIMAIGFGLVFSVLVLLIFVIKLFGAAFIGANKSKAAAKAEPVAATVPQGVSEADVAAIAAALYFEERGRCTTSGGVLTFKPRAASDWNSKILSFTNLPERK